MHAQKTTSASSRPKRVVVMTNRMTVDCQDRLRGIERFLETEADWSAHFVVKAGDMTGEVVREESRHGADGFIVDISVGTDVLDALAGLRVPVVTIDVRGHAICEGRRNVRTVCCDDEGVARAAVTHFLDQERFHSFAFARGGIDAPWAQIREQTFTRMLADRGIFCHVFEPSQSEPERKSLVRWLRKLPKPAAVMAVNDDTAARVARAAADARLRIPQSVAVLGSDNDELVCQNSTPTLSSIPPDFEEEGFRAAQILDALMNGTESVPVAPLFVPVRQIAVRESTAPVSQAGFLIRRAQQFIDKNACKGIGVDDVARHLGISRRLLYLRFKEIKGISPFASIRDRRLEAVRHRLLTTHETVAAIAADCGFESETHLMHLFKRRFGVTMRAFRRRARP